MKNSLLALGTLFLLFFSFSQVKAHYLNSNSGTMMIGGDYEWGLYIGKLDGDVFWEQNALPIRCFGEKGGSSTADMLIKPKSPALLIVPPKGKEHKYEGKFCYDLRSSAYESYLKTLKLLDDKIANDPRSEYFRGVKDGFMKRVCELAVQHGVGIGCDM